MFQNYSKWFKAVLFPIWVVIGFITASFLSSIILMLLPIIGINPDAINPAVLNSTVAAVMYVLTLLIVIGLPWLIKHKKTTLEDVGLDKLMSWLDIIITPVSLVIYLILTLLITLLATQLFPWFDVQQVQDTGFSQLNQRYEYILAFVTLVVVAPIAEETLFRGYLYGKLRKIIPFWVAILITSLLFGLAHGVWNVGVDTFALSIVMCLLREVTGGIWASILLHMTKNGIAFYLLFINPSLLTTIGK